MTAPDAAPFVVFGEDWGRHNFTGQYLAEALARRSRVLWVNGLGQRAPSFTAADLRRAAVKLRAFLRERGGGAAVETALPENVTVTAPLVLPFHDVAFARRINRGILRREFRSRLRAPGMEHPVVIAGIPTAVDGLDAFRGATVVYYCADDYAAFPGVERRVIEPLERELLERADLVLATSRALEEKLAKLHRRVVYFPHGVHVERFARAMAADPPIPADLPPRDRPIVAFLGLLGEHIDPALLERTAREIPQIRLMVIGPVEAADAVPKAAGNLHLLGGKPHEALPDYLAHASAGLLPYRLTTRLAFANPVKLREYLAAGIPAVTTTPVETAGLESAVRVAPEPAAFVAAVRELALAAPKPDRAAIARLVAGDSWEARAETLRRLLAGSAG